MKVEDQSVTNLIQTDLNENNLEYSKIDAGFVAEQKAKDLLRDKKISDRQVMAFKMEAKEASFGEIPTEISSAVVFGCS